VELGRPAQRARGTHQLWGQRQKPPPGLDLPLRIVPEFLSSNYELLNQTMPVGFLEGGESVAAVIGGAITGVHRESWPWEIPENGGCISCGGCWMGCWGWCKVGPLPHSLPGSWEQVMFKHSTAEFQVSAR
jgi:hypothetical protein